MKNNDQDSRFNYYNDDDKYSLFKELVNEKLKVFEKELEHIKENLNSIENKKIRKDDRVFNIKLVSFTSFFTFLTTLLAGIIIKIYIS